MTRIIAGFGSVGKTTLAKKYKNVLDLESTPYKYLIENYGSYDAEAVKGQDIYVLRYKIKKSRVLCLLSKIRFK